MNTLVATQNSLVRENRWDFDYHSPAELIKKFNPSIVKKVIEVAKIVKLKKDPTRNPTSEFRYIDISCIDVEVGEISGVQELVGEEAPSRARKLVSAYDIIISTCRPTRKAIAVVPEELHGQICSTGFSVLKVKKGINPYYLHFVLRLDSTIEQFRKFSTGSSYPAILDADVEKTLIPVPDLDIQDNIVRRLRWALQKRNSIVTLANKEWEEKNIKTTCELSSCKYEFDCKEEDSSSIIWQYDQIIRRIEHLPIVTDSDGNNELEFDFSELDE